MKNNEKIESNKDKKKDRIGFRKWLIFILVGFTGQIAWNVENMYLANFIFSFGYSEYHVMVSLTVAISAIVAFIATVFMGALSDKKKNTKIFISVGYILWGISTASFGLINVENVAYLFPFANASFVASIFVIIIDAIMTFIGSTANDAAFNSYVTKEVSEENRGKVEGVLSILPLLAMLLIFGVLDSFTQNGEWMTFFFIIGGIAFIVGIISIFLIPNEKKIELDEKNNEESYFKVLIDGFRIKSIKENKLFYINLISYLIFGIATQVFFSYMITYFQYSLEITGTTFVILMGTVLIIGSILTVLSGFLMDKIGKNVMLIPSMVILFIGCLGLYFLDKDSNIYVLAIFGIIMIYGYIFGGTVLNAIVRDKIPHGKEGSYMGVRMLFAITLPMVFGSLISGFIIEYFHTGEYIANGEVQFLPPAMIWLVGGIIALVAIIPMVIYIVLDRKNKKIKEVSNEK